MSQTLDNFTYESQNFTFPKNCIIYNNVSDFVKKNIKFIKKNNNIVVFLLNRLGGFGSALLMHIQNEIFLKYQNPNITVIPHFSQNSELFKYHEECCPNSFFLYFENKICNNIRNKKIFIVRASEIKELPFYNYCVPIVNNYVNLSFIKYFNNNYELKIGENIKNYIQDLRNKNNMPLIGIHIRSIFQKKLEYSDYLKVSIDDRLQKLSETLNNKYDNYTTFIATDVESYITLVKKYLKNVCYLDYISRIENDYTDSIPLLENHKGFKLGSDILYDCLGLSLCDEIYVSGSNVPFIVSLLNENIKMQEY